jgi:hypothetical protein
MEYLNDPRGFEKTVKFFFGGGDVEVRFIILVGY